MNLEVTKPAPRPTRNSPVVICLILLTCTTPAYCLDPPPLTDVNDFFVFNRQGVPPVPSDWRLRIDGAVGTPLALDINAVREYTPAIEMATLECAWSQGPFLWVGNANWTGIPLRDLLQAAGPLPEAKSIAVGALDGYVLGDLDITEVMSRDDILLAYEMNDRELPVTQGYPLRLVVPGAGGFHWVQWVERIEVKDTGPSWAFQNFPPHARILWPEESEILALGAHTIRGMVMAGDGVEIVKVEVSTDGGDTWQTAELLTEFVPNVWKH